MDDQDNYATLQRWASQLQKLALLGRLKEEDKEPCGFSPKDRVLRGLILYQEIVRVKFKKDRIVLSKTMNRYKILCGIRNMKNVI
jgi:hypothetical protein